jgi:SPP1 family predicted phage head-tail adaptor
MRQQLIALANRFYSDTFKEFVVKIDIEAKTNTDDGMGGISESWALFANVDSFAEVKTSKELNKDNSLVLTDLMKFTIKHINGITSDMRIKYNGEYYNIESINNINQAGIIVEILARKGVTQ